MSDERIVKIAAAEAGRRLVRVAGALVWHTVHSDDGYAIRTKLFGYQNSHIEDGGVSSVDFQSRPKRHVGAALVAYLPAVGLHICRVRRDFENVLPVLDAVCHRARCRRSWRTRAWALAYDVWGKSLKKNVNPAPGHPKLLPLTGIVSVFPSNAPADRNEIRTRPCGDRENRKQSNKYATEEPHPNEK